MDGENKRWKSDLGYGFILADDGFGDVFFHHTDIIKRDGLTMESKASFDVENTERGEKAVNVVVIED